MDDGCSIPDLQEGQDTDEEIHRSVEVGILFDEKEDHKGPSDDEQVN